MKSYLQATKSYFNARKETFEAALEDLRITVKPDRGHKRDAIAAAEVCLRWWILIADFDLEQEKVEDLCSDMNAEYEDLKDYFEEEEEEEEQDDY